MPGSANATNRLQHAYHHGRPVGGRDALHLLLEAHYQRLRRCAMHVAGDDEDVASQAIANLLGKLGTGQRRRRYEPSRPWLCWAQACLRNEVRTLIGRQGRRRRAAGIDVEWLTDTRAGPVTQLMEHEWVQIAADVLAGLDEEKRRLLVDRFLRAKSLEAMGQERGWSVTTAWRHLRDTLAEARRSAQNRLGTDAGDAVGD